jgi:hypothetical protein
VKEDERGGQGHTSASLLHQSVTPRCEHALFLHECFFIVVVPLSVMDGKIKQGVCIKFCVKLGKSATETREMLSEASGEHSLTETAVFECHSRSKSGRVSVEDDECSGLPSTSKTTENVEKI